MFFVDKDEIVRVVVPFKKPESYIKPVGKYKSNMYSPIRDLHNMGSRGQPYSKMELTVLIITK